MYGALVEPVYIHRRAKKSYQISPGYLLDGNDFAGHPVYRGGHCPEAPCPSAHTQARHDTNETAQSITLSQNIENQAASVK